MWSHKIPRSGTCALRQALRACSHLVRRDLGIHDSVQDHFPSVRYLRRRSACVYRFRRRETFRPRPRESL